jgi:hypothetical protein
MKINPMEEEANFLMNYPDPLAIDKQTSLNFGSSFLAISN